MINGDGVNNSWRPHKVLAPRNPKPAAPPARPKVGAGGGDDIFKFDGQFGIPGRLGVNSSLIASQNGSNGLHGGHARNIMIIANQLVVVGENPALPGWISAKGGGGQRGASAFTPGGDGGAGGEGGDGIWTGKGGNGGDGGRGGPGARGGRGGNGGNGGVVTILTSSSVAVLQLDDAALAGGKGAAGGVGAVSGNPGPGGAGGHGGPLSFGAEGQPGNIPANPPFRNDGSPGNDGQPGRFVVR